MKTALLLVVLIGLLTVTIVLAVRGWVGLGPVDLGLHGFLAMGLGVFFMIALGVGLMALVFHSSRQGYDQ